MGQVRAEHTEVSGLVALHGMADVAKTTATRYEGQLHLGVIVPEKGEARDRVVADEEETARAVKRLQLQIPVWPHLEKDNLR
jgi:hypothetical protein